MRRGAWSVVATLSAALLAACNDPLVPDTPASTAPVLAASRRPSFSTMADGMTGTSYFQSFTLAAVTDPSVASVVYDVFGNPYNGDALAALGIVVTDPFTGVAKGAAGTGQVWNTNIAPTPWHPTDFDVAIHLRDQGNWYAPAQFIAAHGMGCVSYQFGEFQTAHDPTELRPMNMDVTASGSHTVGTYDDMNYRCRNHMMTALRATALGGGYGAIFVTPNAMVDISSGEASIKFALGTLRTSGRDWVDIWISPWDENLKLPLDATLSATGVDLQGPPRHGIHVRMIPDLLGTAGYAKSAFEAYVIDEFTEYKLPTATTDGYEKVLTPISTRRDTFELRLSRTHLSFGLRKPASPALVNGAWNATGSPAASITWIDTPLPTLPITRGVVQFGHHSFTPELAANPALPSGTGGTWHWDDFTIAPAVPFTIINGTTRFADASHPTVTLASATPAGSYLRFAAYGSGVQVSLDGGKWNKAVQQDEKFNFSNRFHSYWMPIPAGVTNVSFRNTGGPNSGTWIVRDVAAWSQGSAQTPTGAPTGPGRHGGTDGT